MYSKITEGAARGMETIVLVRSKILFSNVKNGGAIWVSLKVWAENFCVVLGAGIDDGKIEIERFSHKEVYFASMSRLAVFILVHFYKGSAVT